MPYGFTSLAQVSDVVTPESVNSIWTDGELALLSGLPVGVVRDTKQRVSGDVSRAFPQSQNEDWIAYTVRWRREANILFRNRIVDWLVDNWFRDPEPVPEAPQPEALIDVIDPIPAERPAEPDRRRPFPELTGPQMSILLLYIADQEQSYAEGNGDIEAPGIFSEFLTSRQVATLFQRVSSEVNLVIRQLAGESRDQFRVRRHRVVVENLYPALREEYRLNAGEGGRVSFNPVRTNTFRAPPVWERGRVRTIAGAVAGGFDDREEQMIKQKVSKEKFYNTKLVQFLARRLADKVKDGEIGIEIECEGTRLFREPLAYWGCHSDGSLRGVDGEDPVEYVLRDPLSRNNIPKALSYLSSRLKTAKSDIRDSHRTSVHIHFNCQQMTLKEIFTFVCLYLIFENLLVDFSGPERVGNLFCQRAKDSQYWVHSIVEAFRNGDFSRVFDDNLRYTSCNTASLDKFGSLEFRSLRGTVDTELIQNWIDILCVLKDKSKQFSDPLKLYEAFYEAETDGFFNRIFGDSPKLKRLLEQSSSVPIQPSMSQGSIFVRDIAYSIEEWSSPLAEKKETGQKPPVKKRRVANVQRGRPREALDEGNGVEAARRRWLERGQINMANRGR